MQEFTKHLQLKRDSDQKGMFCDCVTIAIYDIILFILAISRLLLCHLFVICVELILFIGLLLEISLDSIKLTTFDDISLNNDQ